MVLDFSPCTVHVGGTRKPR